MSFGQEIKRLRDERGWSQYELAAKSGVPRTTIASIERGRSIPKTDILLKFAKAFNIRIEELYEAAGFIVREKGTPYEAQEPTEQILDRIKLDIRRLEKRLSSED